MDPALFKGAKGIRVRCRKCGNSLDVLNPVRIGSDRNVVNDTSFSRDPSDISGIEHAVPLAEQEPSTSTEMELTVPVREPACLSQEDGEEEESRKDILRYTLPVSAKGRSHPTWRCSPLTVLFIFLLLFVGGSAYLIFTKVGKGMLSGIAQNLADAILFFRS
jgi:hypothetical protein